LESLKAPLGFPPSSINAPSVSAPLIVYSAANFHHLIASVPGLSELPGRSTKGGVVEELITEMMRVVREAMGSWPETARLCVALVVMAATVSAIASALGRHR
jgi:hypothetical protein